MTTTQSPSSAGNRPGVHGLFADDELNPIELGAHTRALARVRNQQTSSCRPGVTEGIRTQVKSDTLGQDRSRLSWRACLLRIELFDPRRDLRVGLFEGAGIVDHVVAS